MNSTFELIPDLKQISDKSYKKSKFPKNINLLTGIYFNCNKNIIISSALIFLLVIIFTYPKYIELLSDNNLKHNYSYFFNKIENPLTPNQINPETHGAKMDFRLTIPLLAKIIGINEKHAKNIVFIYIIQSLLLIPFIFILTKMLQKHLPTPSTFSLVIGASFTYLVKAFVWDYDFWFDGFAYFFILLGLYFQNRIMIFVTLTLACWTDERAVVALSSVYLFHLLSENNFDLPSLTHFRSAALWIRHRCTSVLVVIFCYIVTRYFLSVAFDLQTPVGKEYGVSLHIVPYQLKHRLIGIFLSYEGLWILFLIALVLLVQKQKLFLATIISCIMLGHVILAYSVFDISRSMMYSFPLIIITSILVHKHSIKETNKIYIAASTLCILIPTQYLIFFPRQIPWTILNIDEFTNVLNGINLL